MTKEDLKKRVCDAIEKRADEIHELGEEILRHPELGFKETKTAARVVEKFRALGLSCQTGLAITGVKAELTGRSTAGATLAGGVEVGGRLVRVSAEIRYTRWGSSSFRSALTGLATQLNQADFLLGIMF